MKVLIIDDHAVVRAGVSALLQEMAGGATVLQASDAAAGSALAQAHSDIDIVLLDLMLPGDPGMRALAHFGEHHPGLPVVVLSASESVADVRQALALGALGYVAKSSSPATLIAALRFVLDGEIYIPTFVMRSEGASPGHPGVHTDLTDRQSEVLALISDGLPNKQIAHRLGLSEKTVKAHVTAILRVLNVTGRAQAAQIGQGFTQQP